MRIGLSIVFICTALFRLSAQTTFYVNGSLDERNTDAAYTHATVYVNASTKISNATIIVRNKKIESVAANGKVPAQLKEINLSGKTVYPSFVDLYSNYGVEQTTAKNERSNREQFNTNKQGAFAWNEAIKPEVDAMHLFAYNEQTANFYKSAGFGVVLTASSDGICRGVSALVSTANVQPHYSILASQVTGVFSFNKGSSKQNYPSSLMGSIALIRQTYLDAQWYQQQSAEKNVSLQAFSQLAKLPAIFDAGNKQNVLRAATIANEFGTNYIIKTSGDEYQRIKEIAATGSTLIVPVNFPKPYKITNAYDADLISTADLKHWELAPANLYWLWKNNIRFCITASGCEKGADFLNNLRKAVKHGLPENEALKALTQTPAQLINQQQKIGALQPGMEANFIICSGNLFNDKTALLSHVVQGNWYDIESTKKPVLAESYAMNLDTKLVVNLKKNIAIIYTDTFQVTVDYKGDVVHMLFAGKQTKWFTATATQVDSSVYPYTIKQLSGFLKGDNQNTRLLVLNSTDTLNKEKKQTDTATVVFADSLIWYPFTDYGSSKMQAQNDVLIKNATTWTNDKQGIIKNADVMVSKGKIVSVGNNISCANCTVVDATNKHLTTGIIDEHSHIAIQQGVNEGTQAVTSEVRIGDVLNADDINIYRQLAGGVTSAQLLHGSANPVGGQSSIIKLRWGVSPEQLKISGAKQYIKFALGENVKQANWGDHSTIRFPQTRMGVEQVYVDAFSRAKQYATQKASGKLIRRDLELEALAEILNNQRFITCHSYVQSEINMLMHVADSFGFKVNTFTHILEGYKLADKMKKHGANASTFADWWAYKYEVIDAIPYNAALMHNAGVNVAINSDDAEMGRRLNQEAAKTIKYGKLTEEEAWKTVTLNPAKMLQLQNNLGSITTGKDADLVIWSDNPLSIYAKPEYTFVDGICYYSLARDKYLQEQIMLTRARIINQLLQAQKNGGQTQSHISTPEPNYHCND